MIVNAVFWCGEKAELAIKAAEEAELATEIEAVESEDVAETVTVEQRILDLSLIHI